MVVLFFSRNQVRFKIDIVDRVGNPIASSTTGSATTVANQLGMASLPFSTQERETAFDPATIEAAAVRTYVQRFSRVADTEYRKFGIPVPVKLAMAILESQAGQTRAAIDVNNHFGPVTEGSYYESAWANWRAHSQLIDQRYPQLKDLAYATDAWLDGLAKTNYSTDPKYIDQLRQVIRHFQLEG
jgi:flagellum-specific peptidoglycan hydrolase FlgJ